MNHSHILRQYFRPVTLAFLCTFCSFSFAQSGPGGVSTPTNTVFWLRSDKGITFDGSNNVTTWNDQANATHDATNAATLTNPMYDIAATVGTNGEAGIQFTGASSEFLDIADNNSINTTTVTARTMYIVFQTGSDVTTQQHLYEQGSTTNGLFFYIQGGQLSAGIHSAPVNHTITSAASSIVASTAYVAVLTYDGGAQTLDLQLDGTAATQATSVAASIAMHNTIKIGSDGASGNHYTGHISEIIYYDVVLNDAEIRVVNNYLSEKYGITTANDHYTTPAATYRYELTGVSRIDASNTHTASNGLGGTLYLSENPADLLSDGEHVMAGNNSDNLDNTSADMSLVSGSDRLNRIWFLEKTGNPGARIEFDLVEAGLSVGVAGDYELIRRAGTSGDFSAITFASRAINGNRIQFNITDANFSSGYFTLAIPSVPKKWYVINSGTWDDPNTWTLDPAGTVLNNPESLTPSTSPTASADEVTILSGKTVTLDNDGDIPSGLTKLTVDGTLDFASTSGHGTITELVGSGTLRLSGDDVSTPRTVNLPTITDASNFLSAGTGAGTIEFYGGEDIDITAASTITTFYNLNVNLTSAADDELTVETDITINGDLNITSGNFQINDNTAAVQRTITVNGNMTIAASGEVSVGSGNPGTPAANNAHDTYHQLLLQGDFTNNGTCNFSNNTAPNYTTYTAGGAVTVRFQGASDNVATIANTTQFYNLVIEKGTDQTYILEINSSNQSFFQIFGRNNGTSNPAPQSTTDGNFTSTGKALYLRTGTLKLTGDLYIPSLSDGGGNNGSWSIPSNAALWLDGPNVEVHADAPGDGATANTAVDAIYGVTGTSGSSGGISTAQAFFLFGKLKISDGFLDLDDTGYFRYDDEQSPIFEIEGGAMNFSAMRNRSFGTSTFSWIQSGGAVNVLGDSEGDGVFTAHDYSLIHLASATTIFNMSGGTINFRGVKKIPGGGQTTPTGINIQSSEGNYSVTGGTINIEMNNALSAQLDGDDGDGDEFPASFSIDFTPNFYNLNIINDDAGSVAFFAGQDVVISGDLTISNATTMELNGNNINVGRNFDVATGGTYTQGGNNTTTFDGNSDQAITLAGTLTSDFYDVTFSGTDTKTLFSGDMTASNSLTIESGATINDGGRTIFIENTITNSGTHASGTGGEVEFAGGAADYTVAGDGTGVFGNVTLNDAANDVSMSADQAITGTLTFSQDQLLDISTNGLTMQGASASISGASSTRYIQMAGNASDGGLSMYVDDNEVITYPIGTDAAATPRYTPATATFSNYPTADDGYVTISVGDGELQTLNLSGGSNILTYYWKANHNGFTVLPRVTYDFVYDASDESGNENTYVAGKVLDSNPFTRSEDDVTGGDTSINTGSNTITFNNDNGTHFDVENANYTAGSNAKFTGTATIFYTKGRDRTGTQPLWTTANTWTRSDLTGFDASNPHVSTNPDSPTTPGAGDIVNIGFFPFDDPQTTYRGYPHSARINSGNVEAGLLVFTQMTDAVGSAPVERKPLSTIGGPNDFQFRPTLTWNSTGTILIDAMQGEGTIRIRGGSTNNNQRDPDFSNVDLGLFVSSDSSYILYEAFNDFTITNIPDEVPSLTITNDGWGANDRTVTIAKDFTTNQNLEIQGNSNLVLGNGAGGNATVNNNLYLRPLNNNTGGGELRLQNNGTNREITVLGNVYIGNPSGTAGSGGNVIRVQTGGANAHNLTVHGDIVINTTGSNTSIAPNGNGILFGDDTQSSINLLLKGSQNGNFTTVSGDVPEFSQIEVDKGIDKTLTFTFDNDFNLNGLTNGASKALTLTNGTLILNNAGIDINLTTGGADFSIPSTAGLQISAGRAAVTGTDTGIFLDGLLQIDGTGDLDMDGGDNNYIEYSGSGSATLTVGGAATLTVGSQIRRATNLESGVLSYTQSGTSTVTVGNTSATSPATNRPMFDVRNTGSSFTFSGGTLVIVQDFSTAATPSLYLDPDGSPTVSSGALVQFGNANTPTNGNEDMTIYSTVTLDDLEINTTNGPTLTMSTVGLTLTDDLLIETGTNLDANGLALTISGDFSNVDGVTGFTSNSNTTTFNGSGAQVITGNGTTFYNLTKSTSNTLQLAASTDIAVSNDLRIESGTLDDNDNDISVSGILHNAAIHANNSGSGTNNGIILAGSNQQDITGTGTYSRIRVNNAAGATTSADISVTEQVILNGGILDIQGNELTMDDDAIFVDGSGSGFSATNMVETRRSFTDAGITKTYNGTTASPFTYPIGSGNKYTPVVVTLTQNSQTTPTIAVRASDEPHPNVQEDVDVPEFVDQDNVLQYYWEVTSSGMTDFIGDIEFTYEGTDAYVTSPFTLDDYHTARLLPDDSDNWNKLSTGFNYQAADGENIITFNLSSASADAEIGGDYTAGIEDAVPDQVQTITSNVSTGDWTATGSWNPATVPTGAIVVIDLGDVITLDVNGQIAYRTEINGELIVGSTLNHRLGRVSGTGTMRVNSGSLPAGVYDDFFNCSTGGSVDFGSATDYTLPNEIASIRNLEISDGGTKSLPNVDVVICGDLVLADGATLDNPQNRSITVLGNLILTNGTLNIGSGVTMIVQGNATVTAGTLNIGSNTLTVNGSFDLDGGTVNMGTSGTLDIDTDFTIDGGTLNGANSSTINIGDDLTLTSGTFLVDGTTTTVNFDGTGAQVVTGDFTGGSSFNNLTINSSGSVTIVDAGNNDVEVDGTLTLTLGDITTTSTNTLTITSTGSIAGGSASSFVNGPLTKASMSMGEDFTFHVGAATRYALAGVENVGTGGQDWTAEFSPTNTNSGQMIDITTNPSFGEIAAISTNGSWTITSSGTNTAAVVLGVQSHMGVLDLADARVAVYDNPTASEWVNIGGTSTGTTSDGTVTSQTTAGFSARVFSFGGIGASALPVELLGFSGKAENNVVKLKWSTASELNNDYFEIRRSLNGVTFETIGTVDGNGNSSNLIDYSFTDGSPASGANFYQLRQVDFDGAAEDHHVITVDNNFVREGVSMTIYPNPATQDNLNFIIQSGDDHTPFHLKIVDLSGRIFHSETIDPEFSFVGKIQANEQMKSGIYYLLLQQGSRTATQKLIIK